MSQASSTQSNRTIFSSRSSSRLGRQFNRGQSHKERFNEEIQYGLDEAKPTNLLSKRALEDQTQKGSLASKKSSITNYSQTASKQSVALSRSKVRTHQTATL